MLLPDFAPSKRLAALLPPYSNQRCIAASFRAPAGSVRPVTARSLRRGRLIDLLLWATTACLSLLTLLFSFGLSAPGAGTFAFADKIGHGLMYFATFLCLLLAAVWRPGRGDGSFPTMALPLAIGVVVAGIAIEVLQEAMTGERHAEVGDVLAEAVGAFGALAIHTWMRRAEVFAG